jgi:putative membrane protein
MNSPEEHFLFDKPQRQAPAAVFFILLTFLRRSVRRFWPLILVLFFQRGEKWEAYAFGIFALIAVVQLVSSLISYFRFYFYIEGEELILEHRRLSLLRTNIPLDRVQTVEFEQGVLHRFLNVVRLQIDTAGSSQTEMSLDALSLPQAEALRDYILEQKAILLAEKGETETPEEEELTETKPVSELLFSLSLPELFRIGLAQNHLRTAGIIVGFAVGLWQYVDEYFLKWDWENLGQAEVFAFLEGLESQADWLVLGLAIGVPFLLLSAVVLSVGQTILRYFGFQARQTSRGIKLQAGLLTRREQSATRSKLQLVRWYQTFLEVRLKFRRVRLFQASSQGAKRKESLSLPGASIAHLEQLKDVFVSREARLNPTEYGISPAVIIRRILFLGVLPALLISGGFFITTGGWSLLSLLLIPYQVWAARRYHANFQIFATAEAIWIEEGVWGKKGSLLPWYKVQAVRFRQTPYQRRYDLTTLQLITAGGKLELPFLPQSLAHEIADYALYAVESSNRAWM